LDYGLARGSRVTLISASAGFGKTTLASEWAAHREQPIAWLSLDEGDSDPVRFISYLIAALQTVRTGLGEGLLAALQAHQPPSTEAVLTALLNEIITVSNDFLFVLDDYHVIHSGSVDDMLSFLVQHQPPQIHLVIATREDPSLPLARLRVRGQLTEIRAADLRFTPAEAAEFLNQMMGLHLTDEDVAALESRTEGWIAGLQLAALSMQGRGDNASFIQAFTGSHRFVLGPRGRSRRRRSRSLPSFRAASLMYP
jgi:LuxR family maltose regulon positive regulatory protein